MTPPSFSADPDEIKKTINLLRTAKSPLVIIGKGAGYARAEDELKSFVESTNIPFLPSPMGKGLIDDDHSLSVSSARSIAIETSDVVILAGARLNWMFNFGESFKTDTKIIQIDIQYEEIHNNRQADVVLLGNIKKIFNQLNKALSEENFPKFDRQGDWWKNLDEKRLHNTNLMQKKLDDDSLPLKYHFVLNEIKKHVPFDSIIVNEGANTMDIGRVILPNHLPRTRLDAGTMGTMGVGVGYALAAALTHPHRKVVAVLGDSAFGFCGMEIEVACRYELPITFIILNNNGIYSGSESIQDRTAIPATTLTPNSHYEKIMEAFGGKGYFATNSEQFKQGLVEALTQKVPSLINVMIDTSGPIPPIVLAQGKAKH